MTDNLKAHWEQVYQTKKPTEVSWYQATPHTSIAFLEKANLPKSAKIIDIGGGESNFVDYLLKEGYENITVLDISETAIQQKQTNLGGQASRVTWIVSNITTFLPTEKYAFWHDRATFHFLTEQTDIARYVQMVSDCIIPAGKLIVGTFSENAPTKCSGLPITQYTAETLCETFATTFQPIEYVQTIHSTPNDKEQNFIFGSFIKK